jgi:hypothetical protein
MFGTSIFLISLFNTGAIISFDKEIALSLKDNVPKTGSSQFLSIGIPSYSGCQDIPIDHSNKFLFIDVSNKTGVISKSSIFQDGDIRATKDDSKFTVILIVEKDTEYVGKYYSGIPVYDVNETYLIVLWPEKKIVGFGVREGRAPRERTFRQGERQPDVVYGDADTNLALDISRCKNNKI